MELIEIIEIVPDEKDSVEATYRNSKSSGIMSSCHDTLLETDIYETCIPYFEDYFTMLAILALDGEI